MMIRTMKKLWLLLFTLFISPLLAEPVQVTAMQATKNASVNSYILTAEMWARPRSGQAVLSMPPVHNAVAKLLETANSHLLIRYPGGDEGSIWAEELQSWLIALGIEPALIEMRPGSTPEQIELQLMTTVSVK